VCKQLAQWNSGATRESNPGPRARIPTALTTTPLSHVTWSVFEGSTGRSGMLRWCWVTQECGGEVVGQNVRDDVDELALTSGGIAQSHVRAIAEQVLHGVHVAC